MESLKIKPQSFNAWVAATRPKTMLAAISPVVVGSFMTPLANVQWGIFICALLTAICITIATNMINDALDFKKGCDTEERIGPMRVTQSGLLKANQVLMGGFVSLSIAAVFALPLMLKGGAIIVCAFILSALFSFLYTGGPFPLAYLGLAELFVIIFYGFGATAGSYYLQTGSFTLANAIAALQMGCFGSVMIAIGNLRDMQQDRKANKMTLIARFGVLFGKWEVTFLILFPFLLNTYWYLKGQYLPFLLPLTAVLIGINILRSIWKHEPSRLYNRYFGEAALLMILFSVLLIIGLHL